ERVVHPADREGRNPTDTLLLKNAANPGRYIDRHGCALLCMEPSVIGLAIAGNPENDGHLSPRQAAVGHEIIPDTHKNGCANEATTGLTLGLVAEGRHRGAVRHFEKTRGLPPPEPARPRTPGAGADRTHAVHARLARKLENRADADMPSSTRASSVISS